MTKTIKWVIAHEPVHLFLRTAEAFAKEIDNTTNGKIKIEILTVEQYVEKYNAGVPLATDGNLVVKELFKRMEQGEIEMSQTSVSFYGNIDKHFLALDLPFLFNDHDHATRVFEGPIGRTLCNSLSEKSGIKGLGFTYSGGWRVIGSDYPITGLDQLADKSIRVNHNPVNYITMENLGANPVPHHKVGYGYDAIAAGELDATETTYLRFKGRHILKTGHSLFLTTIAISKQFWNSLDAETQELMHSAATAAAKIERYWSVEDCVKFERECSANGIEIHELAEAEQERMREVTARVYEEVDHWFTPGFINSIKLQ